MFVTFFKVFFLVVVFGLFNGLFVLPVVLSLVGPTSYKSTQSTGVSTPSEEVEPLKPIIKRDVEEEREAPTV